MHKTNRFTYMIAAIFAVIVLIISFLLGGGAAVVHAATSITTEFEQQSVMDDLKTATINGKPFDTFNYPYDSTGLVKHPEIMTVVEYCYSIRAAQRENYGVYIYFYNPQALNISTASRANKITLGVKYSMDKDGNISVDDYEKFDLQFCSKSDGDYRDLFYKFKIIDHKSTIDGKTFAERVNSNARRYDISEVELLTVGDNNATAYTVGGSYIFTGYAKGYGVDPNAESTLTCEWKELETVTLDVHHTFYRTTTSSKGSGYQVQLDTVYFAVPDYLFEKFGSLQRIKAEWYEYQTKDIVVTNNYDFYKSVKPYLGESTFLNSSPYYNEDIGYCIADNLRQAIDATYYDWAWNVGYYFDIYPGSVLADKIYNLFYTTADIKDYDPYSAIVDIGGVSSNELYNYLFNYSGSCSGETLQIKNNQLSADLFTEDISESRKIDNEFGKIQKGYSYYDFDIDTDLQVLQTYNPNNNSFWENQKMYGFWNALFKNYGTVEQTSVLPPIQVLTDNDVKGTSSGDRKTISDTLCVNYNDVEDLQNFYNKSVKDNCKVVLFRFATSDYYSSNLTIVDYNNVKWPANGKIEGQAYRAFESVFFDFDIIQLTFSKDGVLTVIPVVSNPIDIVNGITPPVQVSDGKDLLKLILALIAVILLFVLFYPILSPILGGLVKGLLWLITAPFKALGKLFKRKKE